MNREFRGTTETGAPPEARPGDWLVNRAVRWMVLVAIGALVISGWGGMLSVLAGGGLAFANFILLRRGVDAALSGAAGRGATAAAIGFLGRFVLILAGLFAIFQLSFLSLLWAVGGLSVFVLAGIEEAIRLLLRN